MTADTVRHLAQQDPTPRMVARFGEEQLIARDQLTSLVGTLRILDDLTAKLLDYDITVSVDLGPIGNAAAAARRDLEKQRDTPKFRLPTPSYPHKGV